MGTVIKGLPVVSIGSLNTKKCVHIRHSSLPSTLTREALQNLE